MPAPDLLPLSALHLRTDSSPDLLIDALAFVRFITGEQPTARRAALERLRKDAVLHPADARCLRSVRWPRLEPSCGPARAGRCSSNGRPTARPPAQAGGRRPPGRSAPMAGGGPASLRQRIISEHVLGR